MSWLRSIRLQLRAVFRSGRHQNDLDEEMRAHLEELVDEFKEEGMTGEQAEKRALKEFGNIEAFKEDCRDSWGVGMVRDLKRSLRFGFRLSLRDKSTTLLSLFVLSLGLGIAVVVYAIPGRLIEMAMGAELSDRHFFLEWETGKAEGEKISSLDFKIIRDEVNNMEALVGVQMSNAWIHVPGKRLLGKQYHGALVSENGFDFLDTLPLHGRLFSQLESGDEISSEIVISHALWEDFFSRDEEALGSTIMVNNREKVIIGIMPMGFSFPQNQKFWMSTDWKQFDGGKRTDAPELAVFGRLKAGRSIEHARVELGWIASVLASAFPSTNEEQNRERIRLTTYRDLFITSGGYFALSMGLGISYLVLLLACSNVFHTIISRTAGRSHELAVRCSLGATRKHVMWQVIADGLMLAGVGAIVGVGLAALCLSYATDYVNAFTSLPGLKAFRLDPGIVFYSVTAAVGAGLGASFVPAWRASKVDVYSVLKDDSKSSASVYVGKLSRFIVISQVAFSTVVLFFCLCFLVLIPGYWAKSVELPYNEDSVLTAKIWLGKQYQGKNPQDLVRFYNDLDQRLLEVPGIRATALTSGEWGLLTGGVNFQIEGQEQDEKQFHSAHTNRVSPNLLQVFGLRVLSGRMINHFDLPESSSVCVVDSSFVEQFCKDTEPIGMRLKMFPYRKPSSDWITIVGVVPNFKPGIPLEGVPANIYFPYTQMLEWSPTLMVNVENADDRGIRLVVRKTINDLAPESQISGGVMTVKERFDYVFGFIKTALKVGAVIGVFVLSIALIGLYSIIAFTTSQRRKEFGIRMALGAGRWRIADTIVKPWLIAIGVGLILGYLGIVLLPVLYVTFVEGDAILSDNFLMFAKTIMKPYLWVVIMVCFVSLAGMGVPAWRATRIHPMDVIRDE